MKTQTDILKQAGQDGEALSDLMMRLCTAVNYLQVAQGRLIAALRPTHDRVIVNEAREFSEACADEIKGVREALGELGVEAEAA